MTANHLMLSLGRAFVAQSRTVLADLEQQRLERLACITPPGPSRIAPARVAFVEPRKVVEDSPEARFAMRYFGVRM